MIKVIEQSCTVIPTDVLFALLAPALLEYYKARYPDRQKMIDALKRDLGPSWHLLL